MIIRDEAANHSANYLAGVSGQPRTTPRRAGHLTSGLTTEVRLQFRNASQKETLMRILVTGGAGYIGSHTLLQILRDRHEVLVIDNFSNSSPEVLRTVKLLTNSDFNTYAGDIRDPHLLNKAFSEFKPDAVIHFAGLKAVGESNEKPLEYYSQNFSGSIELLKSMHRHGCCRIVFSSSATVYGEPDYLPFDECHSLRPTNPYGRTKYFVEEAIRDWASSHASASAVLLRYFNPVGADASIKLGEDPKGVPNNLLPYIARVATRQLPCLRIFGKDYETRDGTGERDYIHVEDLARAHLAAIKFTGRAKGCEAINVGTGRGSTVLEIKSAFEKASRKTIPFEFTCRREGDVARSVASAGKAERLLGWKAELGIDDMCESAWLWQARIKSQERI